MRNPIDIVGAIVDNIDCEIIANSITLNVNNTFTINTCDTKYATIGLDINGIPIINVTDTGITLQSVTTQPYVLSKPKYYYGTLIELNKAINDIKQIPEPMQMAYPMCYFPEVRNRTKEFLNSDKEMQISVDLIVALPYSNEWSASDFKELGTNPSLKIVEAFIEAIKSDGTLDIDGNNWDVTIYSKLGEKRDIKGAIATIINDRCTGVILEIDLIVYKNFKCKC